VFGAAETTGSPTATPRRTPALADIAAAPTGEAKGPVTVFINHFVVIANTDRDE